MRSLARGKAQRQNGEEKRGGREVGVIILVVALSAGLQVFEGLAFPDNLIVSLLIANVLLSLRVLRKRASSENKTP